MRLRKDDRGKEGYLGKGRRLVQNGVGLKERKDTIEKECDEVKEG